MMLATRMKRAPTDEPPQHADALKRAREKNSDSDTESESKNQPTETPPAVPFRPQPQQQSPPDLSWLNPNPISQGDPIAGERSQMMGSAWQPYALPPASFDPHHATFAQQPYWPSMSFYPPPQPDQNSGAPDSSLASALQSQVSHQNTTATSASVPGPPEMQLGMISGMVAGQGPPSPLTRPRRQTEVPAIHGSGEAGLPPMELPLQPRSSTSSPEGVPLALPSDEDHLSEYQCLVRSQIELFASGQADAEGNMQGRNRPIVLNQVGIRCIHCARIAPNRRPRGAVYYPSKLSGLYQAAQNMTINHLTDSCQSIPPDLKSRLIKLKEKKSYMLGGGKGYWSTGGRIRNLTEVDNRLFFAKSPPSDSATP